ncbi:protein O-linked-mannose beta-1,2-N-acetylglucosaminyltransferase 1-like [Scylla paramamosain]|uniref:protein O-linked-mannose beta-1,2-N-acetylglucosaminyltransferase 1-like n=1 Tax=Scylla paramamosain TaxID=85552 RepID=UPI003083E4FD
MRAQREFCDTYEGFSELCRCRDPLTPALARAAAPLVPLQESIPVVVATSRHPYHLYRTLLQLLQMPGGGQTPFLVALEGESAAIRDLAELFGIPCR